jgi:hypothetical protein
LHGRRVLRRLIVQTDADAVMVWGCGGTTRRTAQRGHITYGLRPRYVMTMMTGRSRPLALALLMT